jgi:hypothetical protein
LLFIDAYFLQQSSCFSQQGLLSAQQLPAAKAAVPLTMDPSNKRATNKFLMGNTPFIIQIIKKSSKNFRQRAAPDAF